MKEFELKSTIIECQWDELSDAEQRLLEKAIAATSHAYARYSGFRVGAAVLLDNGAEVTGCNQENASYPAGICAERSALYAAGAQYPDVAVRVLAVAARGTNGQLLAEPITPCGICRQVIIETETRFRQPVRLLLYGRRRIYVVDGIRHLMPLSFSEVQ